MRIPAIFLLLFICAFTVINAQDTSQQKVPGRANSAEQQQKPYVIMISADGFRYDFAGKYQATSLLKLSKKGVRAESMKPSYPTLTFPNHYTLVTGMYPAHHGLVDNSFYDEKRKERYTMGNRKTVTDGSWYGGIPLWVLAEQQQMLSASYFWVGSESNILNTYPSYYYIYHEKADIGARINTVKNWLQLPPETRPHFISFYFPEVDHAAHRFGPDSEQTKQAVKFVDSSIHLLTLTLDSLRLPLNYIFVSDHGMTSVDYQHTITLPFATDSSRYYIPPGEALLHVYVKSKEDTDEIYRRFYEHEDHFKVYKTSDTPPHWHYTKSDDYYNRIGDLLLVPQYPKVFNLAGRPTSPGKHGFSPDMKEMHATFMAWGPAFRKNLIIPEFENIHVYPLVGKILRLNYTHTIDGRPEVLAGLLKSSGKKRKRK